MTTRVLILCTHNSARSQMGEGLLRHLAREHGLDLDLSTHTSKTLFDVPDPWNFDYVITVCDSAAENCPNYPARTHRLHYPFTDPSGGSLDRWRAVRDQMRQRLEGFTLALRHGQDVPASYERTPHVTVD